ncbi:MAG TPA: DUF6445 family protein [Caulobacterales bacterium]|nr:DUF6445 family protein [Caulobacterales bacterium]
MTHAIAPANVEIVRIGAEARPVIVVENFVERPEDLAGEAAALSFEPVGRFYPGVKAPFALARMTEMAAPYQDLLRETFGGVRPYRAVDCNFSIVTTAARELHALQRIPHVDTVAPDRIAVLVYLSGAQLGGTAFYRHKSTGFEYLDASRSEAYNAALDRDVERHGPPSHAYMAGDTPLFEMIAAFDAKPGRALIYSVQSLHSGFIHAPEHLTADPRTGRLTLNGFLSAE